jgi:hypothetical protein
MGASRRFCASVCCSGVLVAGCARATIADDRDASEPSPSAPALAYAPVASRATDVGDATDEPVSAKSVGHTSFVLKVTLSDGEVGAFKPRSKRPLGDRRYRGEIAAYRLAAALGLDNVPQATPRAFPLGSLRRACLAMPGAAEQLDREALVDADGRVRGAFISWIDGYRVLPLEEDSWRSRWEPWVFDPHATIPREERPLAAAVSTMIAFDYLTANWDRWSGGNVAREASTARVLFVDNDGAFYERPSPDALNRQLGLLRRVVRFSRRFYDALHALDEASLGSVFGAEGGGEPLLQHEIVGAVDARRLTTIQIIEARLATAGEKATLSFE